MAQISAYTIEITGISGNVVTDDRLEGRDVGIIMIDGMITIDFTKTRANNYLTLIGPELTTDEVVIINLK